MKKTILLLSAIFALGTLSTFAQRRPANMTDEEKYLDAMHRNITAEKLFGYVKQLSDPALEGRLAGSPGMAKAVDIVKGYFQQWELTPGGDNGSYIQEFPHPCVEVQPGSTMDILFPVSAGKKGTVWISKSYPWADGWFAGGMTGNGEVTAEVVYAGFGVTAPEMGYDDYKGIDVKGKIVLVEGETPNVSRNPDSLAMWYKHTLHQTKLNNAVEHGAIGLLYKWVPGPNAPYNPGFVYCHVTDTVVNDIFMGTGKTYRETIRQIYKTQKPASFYTGKKAHIKMNATYNPHATGKNIFGVIKGSDPVLCNEYVIISAHLDHLGMIPFLIEGANDNNSSSAVLLGVAEAMAKSKVKPKRSIIFMSVDGEEAGLTGSTYYTKHPLVPKDKVVAILNMEQVGVGLMLGVDYHYGYPELAELSKKANKDYVHRRLHAGESHFLTRPRTDGAVFMQAGYPCMDLWALGGGYYHHPKDNTTSINPETLRGVAEWLFWSAIYIADK
jgi:hypothetical protein